MKIEGNQKELDAMVEFHKGNRVEGLRLQEEFAAEFRKEYKDKDHCPCLKAFAGGADGIIVSGCHPNDCHYTSGNFHARRRWIVFRGLLDFLGIDVRRICYSWVSAAEGAKWAELVNQTVAAIRELGPYEEYKKVAAYLEQEVAYE